MKTELEKMLRNRGCDTVFLCGVSAVGCVLYTWFDAQALDFRAFMIKDAIISHRPDLTRSVEEITEAVGLDAVDQIPALVEIARQAGSRVVQRPFVNFSDQRNAGIELVNTEWVFFVDADDRVSPELREEIRNLAGGLDAGWWIPRKNYIFGRWMRHAGMYPDHQLRLFRAGKAHYDTRRVVHECAELDGKAGPRPARR